MSSLSKTRSDRLLRPKRRQIKLKLFFRNILRQIDLSLMLITWFGWG